MQGFIHYVRSCQEILKVGILRHSNCREMVERKNIFSRFGRLTSSPPMSEKGLENLTVADVLMTKGDEKTGSWIWCRTNDTVYDAAKNMAQNNVGSLVVLKPGAQHVAGIITERDYLKKIIAQGRSSKSTRVEEIMTDENNLITATSDTNILQAMQLMTATKSELVKVFHFTDHHIRHVPVIDGKIVGMISIVDVVQAVVEQQGKELKRLNEFIKGEYY